MSLSLKYVLVGNFWVECLVVVAISVGIDCVWLLLKCVLVVTVLCECLVVTVLCECLVVSVFDSD